MASSNKDLILSDSLLRFRPSFYTFLHSDGVRTAGYNDVQQTEAKRQIRERKIPPLHGPRDVRSFMEVPHSLDPAFKKYNDVGDYRPPAPHRWDDAFLSSSDGFVSVGGDVDLNTGHWKIPSMVQLPTTPQSATPQSIHSIRMNYKMAPPDVKRVCEDSPGAPYRWNDRRVIDTVLRAKLGGWTSDTDPRKLSKSCQASPAELMRDKLAQRFKYTSSTQRSYDEVPWDNMLPPKLWAPTSTLEERPDMINQRYTLKRYGPRPVEWQNMGPSWDMFQKRHRDFKKNVPIPGTVFCSDAPRTFQIPGYGGTIGSTELEERDNRNELFRPMTVMRGQVPHYTETAHRPEIPGYAGSTPQKDSGYYSEPLPPQPKHTSTGQYRRLYEPPSDSGYKRESNMSKMVTTVPPYNPFNKVPRAEVTC